jgi:hypothetical protein
MLVVRFALLAGRSLDACCATESAMRSGLSFSSSLDGP